MKKLSLLVIVTLTLLPQACGRTTPQPRRLPQPQHVVQRPADVIEAGKVVLGSPSLTAGITGTGPLSVTEIECWLADPQNHEPVDVVLPCGLREADVLPTIPPDNPLTRAKIELGRQLFFDARLSESGFTCGHCHPPQDYFSHSRHNLDPTIKHARTVPVAFNRILGQRQLWDGRAASQEEHALMPIFHPRELASTPEKFVQALSDLRGYRMQFERIFGGVTMEAVSKAIAAFERCIVTTPSPYDYAVELRRLEAHQDESVTAEKQDRISWLKQQVAERPMSAAAIRGEALFFSARVGCAECHRGVNFSDEAFHNTGVGMDVKDPDLGRYRITKDQADYGAFKTPTLRNVEHTAPYMHRGQLASLAQVIGWYAGGGFENDGLSPQIKPLDLTDDEKQDLVEFLKSLSSPVTPVETGRLPDDSK